MCCLGFLGKACGISEESLLYVPNPSQVSSQELDKWPPGILISSIYDKDSESTIELMNLNDRRHTGLKDFTEEIREREITRVFSSIGINVTFED